MRSSEVSVDQSERESPNERLFAAESNPSQMEQERHCRQIVV